MALRQLLTLLLWCSCCVVLCSCYLGNERHVRSFTYKVKEHDYDIHGFSFTPLENFHLASAWNTKNVNEKVTPLAVDGGLIRKLCIYLDTVAQLDPLASNAFITGRHSLSHVTSTTDPHIVGALQYTFNQVYNDIPVWGTFVKIHASNHSNTITHINGVFLQEYLLQNASLSVVEISEEEAESIALSTVSTLLNYSPINRNLFITSCSLFLYHNGLTRNQHSNVSLAYQVVIGSQKSRDQLKNDHYYVFVDVVTGHVINYFNNHQSTLNREIWQTQYLARAPVYTEGGTLPSALDAQNIIKYSGDVYSLFKNMLNRDSYDGKGAKMIGVYNIPPNDPNLGCPVQAFWDGTTINFCATMARTDVAVHEWTHAYTEYTQALVYEYQSGALNEAYSDIVAEGLQNIMGIPTPYAVRTDINDCVTIDGTGTKRWVVGDELTQFAQYFPEGLRDMYNPNCQYNPRYTQDSYVSVGTADNGGVHTNSGIPNQGFAILSDGGKLNGVTVNGIGVVKALAIYLRAMTVYQGPTTNFAGHAVALAKSCEDLIAVSLPDPTTGASSTQVIQNSDCDQVANAMAATMMAQPLPTTSTPPMPIIINGFPTVGPISTSGTSPTLFVLASPNLVSDTVYCGFSKTGNQIDDTVSGSVVSTESYTSAICPLPKTWTTPVQNAIVTLSADGENFATTGIQFSTYEDPVVTSVAPLYIPEEGGVITIKGSGFKQYSKCTFNIIPDVNGGMPDCLTCIFGSLDSDHPVAGVFVDSTTISCRVPALSNLTQPYTRAAALFSMNNQVYYPLPDIVFAVHSPIGMGGTIAIIIVTLIVAIVLIGIVLMAFHGMSPAFLKPVDEQLKGLIQSDDGTEKGAFTFKYLRGALVFMVLLVVEFVWTVTLAGTTHTVFAIYVTVTTVFALGTVVFGFVVTKYNKGSLLVVFLLAVVDIVVMVVGFALLCVLISQFREAASVSGKSQSAQIVLVVASLLVHILNIGGQVALARYSYMLYEQLKIKGILDIHAYEAESEGSRDLSHVAYSNAP